MRRERVKKGGEFFYITSNPQGTSMRIEKMYDYGHSYETRLFEVGNYFATIEAAVEYRKRIALILLS